jgi:hypothetical protein
MRPVIAPPEFIFDGRDHSEVDGNGRFAASSSSASSRNSFGLYVDAGRAKIERAGRKTITHGWRETVVAVYPNVPLVSRKTFNLSPRGVRALHYGRGPAGAERLHHESPLKALLGDEPSRLPSSNHSASQRRCSLPSRVPSLTVPSG